MNSVSCQPLKNRRPQGFFWFLLSVLIVLSAVASSRAQTPPTPTTNTVITSNDDLTNIVNGGTFTFATNGTYTTTNTLVITNDTTLDATGMSVVLSANYSTRLFEIRSNATLTLLNLQLTGGKSPQGAAIYNNASTLFASNVTFAGNRATNAAGANGANGTSGNINGGNGGSGAFGYGGAIYSSKGYLILTNCVFTNNIAAGGNGGNGGNGFNSLGGNGGDGGQGGGAYGGAIYSTGTNSISACYFVANGTFGGSGGGGGSGGSGPVGGDTGAGGQGVTAAGAAIYIPAGGVLNLTNSTFAGNQAYGGDSGPQSITANGISSNGKTGGAALGGAIESFGILYTENCTYFQNTCTGGKGGDTLGDPNANAGAGGPATGGAICNAATFTARNCTFATNNVIGGTNGVSPFSNRNGAIGIAHGGNIARISGTSKILNSILQHGLGADNNGTLTDGGHNISSDTSCAFLSTSSSLSKTNAYLLETLTTVTGVVPPVLEFRDLGTTNRAKDFIPAQPSDTPTNFPATDEIGFPRFTPLINTNADAGAWEFEPTAPRIVVQPKDQAVPQGSNATFVVSANGVNPMTNQWYFDGELISFGTNATLIITNVAETNLGTYYVVISNALGSTTSSNATLSFADPPAIQTISSDKTISSGSNIVLTVNATGSPLNYQWYFSNAILSDVSGHIAGSTTPNLTLTNVTRLDQGTYSVVVSNVLGSVTNDVQLTVTDPGIITQPASLTRVYGVQAVFTVVPSSIATNLTYQWRNGTNHINLIGATHASYTNSSLASGSFEVVVKGTYGAITSAVATLTVLNPGITVPPTNLVVNIGSPAVFNVTAKGSTNLTYQWSFNGNPILTNATSTSYTIPSAQLTDGGTYSVTVTETNSATTNTATASATLTVLGTSSISGRVTFGTNGVAGITITNGVTNFVTGSDGYYAFSHLTNGAYTVGPKQIGSGLTPTSTNVVIDGTTATNIINFAFNPPELEITAVPTNNIIPLFILSAPLQPTHLQSSTDLTNWTNAYGFTTDTNGTATISATNTAPQFFLRLISP